MSLGTKGAAKTDEMAKLHQEIAKKFRKILKDGEVIVVAGKAKKVEASAAMLNAIRGFLKDNHIVCDKDLPTRAVGELSDTLDKFNKEDAGLPHFTH